MHDSIHYTLTLQINTCQFVLNIMVALDGIIQAIEMTDQHDNSAIEISLIQDPEAQPQVELMTEHFSKIL